MKSVSTYAINSSFIFSVGCNISSCPKVFYAIGYNWPINVVELII